MERLDSICEQFEFLSVFELWELLKRVDRELKARRKAYREEKHAKPS